MWDRLLPKLVGVSGIYHDLYPERCTVTSYVLTDREVTIHAHYEDGRDDILVSCPRNLIGVGSVGGKFAIVTQYVGTFTPDAWPAKET